MIDEILTWFVQDSVSRLLDQVWDEEVDNVNSILGSSEIVLRRKIFSMKEHYDLLDIDGEKLGAASGNRFQFPALFVVTDINGSEVMHIEGKIFPPRRDFSFYNNRGEILGTIYMKLAKPIGKEYTVERDGVEFMRISGNVRGLSQEYFCHRHKYRMNVNGNQVASVHKKMFSIGDQLVLSITGKVDPRLLLGALIVIEHIEVTESAQKRRS